MALDNVLKIYDEQGNPVNYDILASDVKFQDGKDLPTKLDELEQEIGEGGYTPPQGGIPATDLAPAVQTSLGKADTAYQKPASGIPATDLADGVIPDVSGLATKTELQQGLADKVNKVTGYGLSKNDYTDADKAAVATIPSKANDNVVVKSISVNGQTPQTPTQGNVNINVQGVKGDDGVTPYIGSNGHWWTGPETDSENDTGVTAQGPAGTSYTDADLVIGNALNGQGDVLGMRGAMRIKSNLDFVYSKLQALLDALGNIAFWEGKPANLLPQSLDWSVPQITVTLDKTSVSANAMITDDSDQEITGTSVLVDEGSGLTLKIKPRANNYAITNASATIGGVSQTLTEDNGVYTLELDSVTSAITIVFSVSATALVSVGIVTSNAAGALGLSVGQVVQGGTFVGQVTYINSDYNDFEITSVKDVSNNDVTYTLNGNEITIANVPSAITITAIAKHILKVWFGKTLNMFGAMVDATGECVTDYIKLDNLVSNIKAYWDNGGLAKMGEFPLMQNGRCAAFYDSDKRLMAFDGAYEIKRVMSYTTTADSNPKTIQTSYLQSLFTAAGAKTPLYARFTFKCSGTTIASSASFKQNSVELLDLSNYVAATEAVTNHTLSYTLNNATVDNGQAPLVVPHGQPIEVSFTGTSGHTITDSSIVVTMGGNTLVQGTDYTVTDVSGYKTVRIENITGDLNFNVSIA